MTGSKVQTKIHPMVFVALVAAGVFALARVRNYENQAAESAKNFKPNFVFPIGWKENPHGPDSLFKLTEPSTNLVLRAAVNQIIDTNNPTPELDTKGIAKFYIDRTQESMPNWTATVLKSYSNPKGTDFEVIRRATKDRVVVTAYSVRGNTTLLITLFGKDGSRKFVDSGMPKLYQFLDTVSLNEQDMSSL
jgi:hypothetical protein